MKFRREHITRGPTFMDSQQSPPSNDGLCPRCDYRVLQDHEEVFCISCGWRGWNEPVPRPRRKQGDTVLVRYGGTSPSLENMLSAYRIRSHEWKLAHHTSLCPFCGEWVTWDSDKDSVRSRRNRTARKEGQGWVDHRRFVCGMGHVWLLVMTETSWTWM